MPHAARRVFPGRPFPLGATLGPDGVNFALYSRTASAVFLLLFDDPAGPPTDVIQLEERTRFVWHAFVPGLKSGQLYAYRVRGDFNPAWGMRFNESKLLIDPYAKALTGKARNQDNLLLAYDPSSPAGDLSRDTRDNQHLVPKSIVCDDAFDWRGDTPPEIPLERLFIYEAHLKGFTAHASSGVTQPGTYLGFIGKIPYLRTLGVNAVELLPIQEFYVEDFLRERGLTNYWGYNTLGFFAPESSYRAGIRPGCQVEEFKTLVRELHRAGIEVILDVVYNHTGEGNELGPTLSFRGIDNRSYYELTGPPDAGARYYMNYTGTGNSLDFGSPAAVCMVLDSLRYWTSVMHVDGFRFDLASVLGRDRGGFSTSAVFFTAVAQDPVLQRVKLIAEPWDLGAYEVGNFPVDWSEWNGRFRDTARRFVKGDPGQLPDLGYRLTGSADLYGDDGRSAYNSINFITCHDGFTLRDLVSYNGKHNEANGEGNRDGSDAHQAWNCGAEGETTDPAVLRLRKQQVKNFACLLFFSSGTPMLLGGDEFYRTQGGNNNAYCQDNGIAWLDWNALDEHRDVFDFFRKCIALCRRFPILQRRKFFLGADCNADGLPDLSWFGTELGPPDWQDAEARTLCCQLGAEAGGASEPGASPAAAAPGSRLFVILNADWRVQFVRLPALPAALRWRRIIDTSLPAGEDCMPPGEEVPLDPGDRYFANPRSTVVLLGA
jgi:glycogen operon protein